MDEKETSSGGGGPSDGGESNSGESGPDAEHANIR